MSEAPILSGFQWWKYPRGWRDVVRCVLGRHRRVMTGVIPGDGASPVFRCSCGAMWLTLPGGGSWAPERRNAWKRRKGDAKPIEQHFAEMRAAFEASAQARHG